MSQTNKIYDLLEDGKPHRTDEILKEVYGSEHLGIARIGARIYDLRKKGYTINSWSDPLKPTLTYYQLIPRNLNGQLINVDHQIPTERTEQTHSPNPGVARQKMFEMR